MTSKDDKLYPNFQIHKKWKRLKFVFFQIDVKRVKDIAMNKRTMKKYVENT